VQIAAVHALGKQKGTETSKFLLARWRSMTPAVRSEAGSAVIADPERFQLLLAAIDKGDIQPWSLPLRQRIQMQMNRDPALRERARALLAAKAGNREQVVKRYQAVLDKTTGEPSRGRVTFENICAKCHKMNGVGADVGPDLATVRNRTPDSLLTDILIPSRSIAQMYEAYVVETVSGGTLEGVIGEQTSTTITLVHEQGKKDVIPRSEIKQMYVSNLSAMPEDVDKEISPAQMADLVAYLRKPN
jgi:putative heme-binding domain-containing protein